MRDAKPADRKFGYLFLVPSGVHLVKFFTGGRNVEYELRQPRRRYGPIARASSEVPRSCSPSDSNAGTVDADLPARI